MTKILAFAGSNSKQSINKQFVEAVAKEINGIEVETIDLNDYAAPVYGIDLEQSEGIPASMLALNKKFEEADGFIVSTPEHNGSMPAVLKNTIDWLSRIEQKLFRQKPTLFLSTSPGPRGAISALDHLIAIMPYRGANIVGSYSLGEFVTHVVNGQLTEGKLQEINPLLIELVESIEHSK